MRLQTDHRPRNHHPRYAILQRTHYEWLPQISEYDMDQAFIVAEHVIKAKRAHEEKIFKGEKIFRSFHVLLQTINETWTISIVSPTPAPSGTKPKASKMERSTEKFEEATNVIKDMFLVKEQVTLALPHEGELKGREALKAAEECHKHFISSGCRDSKYRSMDGSCNNLYNPTWGRHRLCSKATSLQIMLMVYLFLVWASKSGKPLPPPRVISLYIHRHMDQPSSDFTHLLMAFGQFVDHDITLTQSLVCQPKLDASQKNPSSKCAVLTIMLLIHSVILSLLPQDDPFFSKYDQDCLNFVRSAPCPLCSLGPRQQMDQLTAFVDASTVYGNQENETEALRSFRDGDARVNQHPALTSLHTIWMRQHNRIAEGLKHVNPHWDDETLFWETRRIIGAQFQMVVFENTFPLFWVPTTWTSTAYGFSSGFTPVQLKDGAHDDQ
ncbi:peroxidasin [Caerostris extrusa]|uniref:Peroxidasin n=1 Tax=Caerostris extrusa TaxID=172846 RepID=A0AAV4N5Z7_CAEEX|nr:peroxidasin [Caerostris extrusa]